MTPSDQAFEPIVYVNGEFAPESQAKISVFDHVVLYGDGTVDQNDTGRLPGLAGERKPEHTGAQPTSSPGDSALEGLYCSAAKGYQNTPTAEPLYEPPTAEREGR